MYLPYRPKYGNKRTVVGGLKFDSKAEANRYLELKVLEKAGEISKLECQPKYILQPKKGKIGAITYRGDFYYLERGGQEVVEDVKGFETAVFKLKKRMFEYHYPHINLRIMKVT